MGYSGENNGLANAVQFMAVREMARRSQQHHGGGRRLARFGYWAGGLLSRWGQSLQARSRFGDAHLGEELVGHGSHS